MSEDRSQLLLINSTHRATGTPSDFTITFHDGCIRAKPGHTLSMIVIDACMCRSWYTVSASNNTFTLTALTDTSSTQTLITIPVGYYDVYSMRTTLLGLLNSASVSASWAITYNPISNCYTYFYNQGPATNAFTFTFTGRCSELMGFGTLVGATAYVTYLSPLLSTAPVKLNKENAVMIHCDVAKRPCSTLDNINTTVFSESDIILKICNSCAPFDNMTYQSQGNDNFNFDLAVTSITALHIYVTDENNTPLQLNFDWTMTLKLVEWTGYDNRLLEAVKEIKDYLNLIVLDKHMG